MEAPSTIERRIIPCGGRGEFGSREQILLPPDDSVRHAGKSTLVVICVDIHSNGLLLSS